MPVLDASLLVALVANDRRSDVVQGALARWLDAGLELHLPQLAFYELASALTRLIAAGALPAEHVEEIWREIGRLPLTFHAPNAGPQTVAIALSLRLASAYDAAYLELAERLAETLWTLDGPLFRNASAKGFAVRLLGESTQIRPNG